jgi:hypothetical protein
VKDELRIERARKTGHPGLAAYLEARAELPPPPTRRPKFNREDPQPRCEATRDGIRCVRAEGHTGPHLEPPDPDLLRAPEPVEPSTEPSTDEQEAASE